MRNLVITGFMGTGKTTVGQAVAARLGRPFVDMDAEIERRAGKPIARIFAEDGEAAFRRWEASICAELGLQRGLVIATGGGALVNPLNRAQMLRNGTVVCLWCEIEELLRRLDSQDNERPLLEGANLRAHVEQLLAARRPAYQAIPWHIDTTGRAVPEISAQICELVEEQRIDVRHPTGSYTIQAGCGLLARVGEVLHEVGLCAPCEIAVVSNPTLASLYGERVEDSLRRAGFRPYLCLIPDGEPHKTLDTVWSLYRQFLRHGLDRSGAVLALGGGMVGDVAGFAAATYLRGVRVVQVPTTLLAMVDASVGGKTGVNLEEGKNLVGAFHHPSAVVIDPEALATLPAEELRSGVAEAIKHAMIGDAALFARLEQGPRRTLFSPPLIARALRVKVHVVEEDPSEQGRRVVLNLGHTVGHALERCTGYMLRHGEAVGLGMVAAARLAVALSLASDPLVRRLEDLLGVWGLPTRYPVEIDRLWEALGFDKKRRAGRLRWVVPTGIGSVTVVEDVPQEVVRAVLAELGEP